MLDLIPIHQILEEIMTTVFRVSPTTQYRSLSKAFEEVKGGSMPSSFEQSTVYENNHAYMKFARSHGAAQSSQHQAHRYPLSLASVQD